MSLFPATIANALAVNPAYDTIPRSFCSFKTTYMCPADAATIRAVSPLLDYKRSSQERD